MDLINYLPNGKLDNFNQAISALASQGYNKLRGMLGAEFKVSGPEASKRSKLASTLTLQEGVYKIVQMKSAVTTAPVVGTLAFWNDLDNMIVTSDPPATYEKRAGVFIEIPTVGNLTLIQIAGVAWMQYITTLTKTSPNAIGDLVLAAVGNSLGKVDTIADATNLTSPLAKRIVGTAYEAAADGELKRVILNDGFILKNFTNGVR